MFGSLARRGDGVTSPLARLESEMGQIMERFFGPEEGWSFDQRRFAPRTNVAETENAVEVTVELPGMKADDFNVEIKEGELWITGEKKEEREQKNKTFHRIERHYGEFTRVIPLQSAVDDTKVNAEYKDGVLKVTVPKTESAKPKRIAIKA